MREKRRGKNSGKGEKGGPPPECEPTQGKRKKKGGGVSKKKERGRAEFGELESACRKAFKRAEGGGRKGEGEKKEKERRAFSSRIVKVGGKGRGKI